MKEVYKSLPQQVDAKARAKGKNFFGFLMDMGTGKSKVVIDEFCELYEKGEITTVIIIAPNGVYRNWKSEELPKHINTDEIQYEVFEYTSKNTSKKYAQYLSDMMSKPDILKIFTINIESCSTDRAFAYMTGILDNEEVYLAIDESHKIKNHKAKCTKACNHYGTLAKYRRILTGTPLTNNPLDYYSQLNFLDPGCAGDSYFQFEYKYAIKKQIKAGTRTFPKVVGYRNIEELQGLVSSLCYRITKEECINLPEKLYIEHQVELSNEQKRAYMEMHELKMMQLQSIEGENRIFASNALTATMKLHQIICGHVKDEQGNTHLLPNKRGKELVELINNINGQVVLWHCYIGDLLVIEPALREAGISFVFHNGSVSREQRQEAINLFKDGNAKVFVATPATAGTGLTLTNANYQIYYSNSYKLGDRVQSEDRLHRIGQHNPVTIIDMVVPGSIDSKVVKSLKAKRSIADDILDNWREIIKL